MEILARHLTIDMYNCKATKLSDMQILQSTLAEAIKQSGFHILNVDSASIDEEHFSIFIMMKEGHISIHTYTNLRYAAIDIFHCIPNAEPEIIFKSIRNIFKPEKTKTTYLKRGDFGTVKDMKPKIKTKVAPLRRIHNTGAKVVRLLARRNHK